MIVRAKIHKKLTWAEIPHFRPAPYAVDVPWVSLENWILQHREDRGNGLDLDPPFQRGYVWTPEQQTAFIEYRLMGGTSGDMIYWNAPGYQSGRDTILTIVDGKQRVTAVREFLAGRVKAFGQSVGEFGGDGVPFMLDRRVMLRMCINELDDPADVIRWYLSMNTGGSIHTPDEIARVRAILDDMERK